MASITRTVLPRIVDPSLFSQSSALCVPHMKLLGTFPAQSACNTAPVRMWPSHPHAPTKPLLSQSAVVSRLPAPRHLSVIPLLFVPAHPHPSSDTLRADLRETELLRR